MHRSIRIFIGEDRIVLDSSHTFGTDGRFCGAPIIRLDHAATVSEILAAVDQALANCREDVPAPTDFKAVMLPLLDATGEKTWRAVSRSFALISVEQADREMIFTPMFPEKGAFVGDGTKWRFDTSNRDDMSAAFRAAAAVAIEAQNLHNPPPLI
jgi:hypothetical protein